ncbi:MAG: hypothetical protein QM589_15575 [Thermomicrobiales bacterium]
MRLPRASTHLATLAERGLIRGREAWHAWQVGAAIAIGQIGPTDDGDMPLREPYPIVRIAAERHRAFDPRERLGSLVLTEPLDLTRPEQTHKGEPGDARDRSDASPGVVPN